MLNASKHLRVLLFLLALALLPAQSSVYAQSEKSSSSAATDLGSAITVNHDMVLRNRAVAALEELKADVFAYESSEEFEDSGRVARVSFETFTDKLDKVTAEVESILPQLSDAKLRSQLSNSLYSFRDGVFWWSRMDQRRVVALSNLRADFATTRAEKFFTSTMPYTVVIHWRQAIKYLLRAQKLTDRANTAAQQISSLASDRTAAESAK